MISALLFLQYHSVKNRLVQRIRRLKQPKYLVGAIAGGLYFYFYFVRNIFFASRARSTGFSDPILFESIGALVLLVMILLGWILPKDRAALTFSEAEVAFLFPAPISRRNLIHFRLLRAQFTLLFSTFLLTLLFRRNGHFLIHALGWWTVLSVLNLHLIGASFVRTKLLDLGVSHWKRRIAILLIIVAAVGSVIFWAKNSVPPPDATTYESLGNFKYYLEHVLQAGPLPYLLAPFRLVVHPYFTTSAGEFLMAFLPAALLLVLHYFWVIRSDVAFEEASVEKAKVNAEKIAAFRAGKGLSKPKKKKNSPFALSPTGNPALAIFWKNLIGAGASLSPRMLFPLVIFTVVLAFNLGRGPSREIHWIPLVGGLLLVLLFFSLLLGPSLMRQDFRQDLQMMDILKTYPLPQWQIVFGELLTPAVLLTAFQWILLLIATAVSGGFPGANHFTQLERLTAGVAIAVVCPALNFLSLMIPNAAVLLFPAWFHAGKEGPQQGIEATGQRIIFALGQVIVFAIALIPAALAAVIVFVVAKMAVGIVIALLCASIATAIVLAGEAALGVMLLGKLFQKFDLSSE